MLDKVRVVVHRREIERMKTHPKVLRGTRNTAEAVSHRMQQLAPRDEGGGAESIHVESGPKGSWYIGPDADHFYMGLIEIGSEGRPPDPFMRPALDGFSSFVREWFKGS